MQKNTGEKAIAYGWEKRVKQELEVWKNAARLCSILQEEMAQIQKLKQDAAQMSEGAQAELTACYDRRAQVLEAEILRLMGQQERIDQCVRRLEREQEMLLRLKYQKRLSIEAICLRMYISRSTFFRMQRKALLELTVLMAEAA